jgi:hypothetical protein
MGRRKGAPVVEAARWRLATSSQDPPIAREADGCVRPRGLIRQKAATQKATLRGNPVEHGNIRVIELGRQAQHCAIRLRYHDLRTRDHRGNSFDDGGVTAEDRPQFSDSVNPASFQWPWSAKRAGSGRSGTGACRRCLA